MRAHVVGIAGSGKTTLADKIGAALDAPVFDLDEVAYDRSGAGRAADDIAKRLAEVRGSPQWVTEGAYRDAWLLPLLDDADLIVWLDLRIGTCVWRGSLFGMRAPSCADPTRTRAGSSSQGSRDAPGTRAIGSASRRPRCLNPIWRSSCIVVAAATSHGWSVCWGRDHGADASGGGLKARAPESSHTRSAFGKLSIIDRPGNKRPRRNAPGPLTNDQ